MAQPATASVVEAPRPPAPEGAQPKDEPAGQQSARSRGAYRRSSATRPCDSLIAGALAIYAIAVWLPYELHATFQLDDFTLSEHFLLGTPLPSYRPGFIVVMQAAGRAFGDHPLGYYVTLAFMMGALAVLLFLALRQLGLATVPSVIAGAAVVAYPRADSIGLWWTGSQMGIALCLGLLSALLGAMWVRRTGRSLLLLLGSLAALAACILTYEAMFPVFLLALCLSPLSPNFRRSAVKGGLDLVAAIASVVVMLHLAAANQQKRPVNSYPGRAVHLAADGWRALFVHGFYRPTVIGAIAVIALVVGIVVLLLIAGTTDRLINFESWPRLLMAVPLLLAATFVSWVAYVPANDWYDPLLTNIGNHVNALAQVFLITAAAAVIWLLSRLVTAPFRTPILATIVATAVGVVVLSGFVGQVRSDQAQFSVASVQRTAILDELHRLLPHPVGGDEILVGDYHLFSGSEWVDVLETDWDTDAAVQSLYDNGALNADPLLPGAVCRPSGLAQPIYGNATVPYAQLQILDVARGRVVTLDSQLECQLELPSLLAQTTPPP